MGIATRGGKRGVSGWTRPEAAFYVGAVVAILIGAVDLVAYYGATMAVASAVNSAAHSAAMGGGRAIAVGDIVKVVVGASGLDPCGIGQIDIYGPTGVRSSAPPMARDRYIFPRCATPGAVAVPAPNTLLYSPDVGTSAASVTVRVLYRYHPPISLFGLDETLVLAGGASQAVGSSLAIGAAPTPVPVSGALAIPVCGALPPAPVIRQVVGAGRRDTLSWAPGAIGATGAAGTVGVSASGGWTIIQYRIDPLIAEQTVLRVAHVPPGQTTVAFDDVSGQRVAYGVAGLNSCGVPGQQSALVDDGRAQSGPTPMVTATPATTATGTMTATPATMMATPATTATTATGTMTATVAAMPATATTTPATTPATATMTTPTAIATKTTPTATVPTITATVAAATVAVGVTTTATATATTVVTATATAAAVQPTSPGIPLVPTPCAGVPMAPAIQRVVGAGQEDTVTWLAASSGPAANGGWTVARYRIDPLIAERTVLGIVHIPAAQTTTNFAVPPGQGVSYGVSGVNSCGVPGPESALATDGR